MRPVSRPAGPCWLCVIKEDLHGAQPGLAGSEPAAAGTEMHLRNRKDQLIILLMVIVLGC